MCHVRCKCDYVHDGRCPSGSSLVKLIAVDSMPHGATRYRIRIRYEPAEVNYCFPPQKCPLPENGISIGSAVFAQHTPVPNTCDVCRKGPHLCSACELCGPVTIISEFITRTLSQGKRIEGSGQLPDKQRRIVSVYN